MTPEYFIAKHLRIKLPDIEQSAIDAALRWYKRSTNTPKWKVFDECLRVAKQHMAKVKR